MVPVSLGNLQSRPRFSWGIRSTQFSDGRGIQEGSACVVKQLEQFHDPLPDGNPNRIYSYLLDIYLKYQPFRRAYDLFSGISDHVVSSSYVLKQIVAEIQIRDRVLGTITVFNEFNDFSL